MRFVWDRILDRESRMCFNGSMTKTRKANHTVATSSGTVHLAADSTFRPAHVLACTGRTIHGAGASLDQMTVTCRACKAGVANGRIEVQA